MLASGMEYVSPLESQSSKAVKRITLATRGGNINFADPSSWVLEKDIILHKKSLNQTSN